MSTIKISALPSGNPAQSGDEIPVARGGTSYKITAGSIADLAGGVEGPVSSVNNQIALFAGTSGDSIQAASTTGILKASSGVIAAAVPGVDYGDVIGADTISTDNAIVRFDGTSGKLIQKSTAGVTDAGFLTANGLTFPAIQVSSADANTLDDYEEGTWTPVFASGDIVSGGLTPTYNTIATKGLYRKIGAVVFVSFQISLTSLVVVGSPVQDIYIEGLPYIPTSSRPYYAMQVVYGSASNFSTNSPSFGNFSTVSVTAATGSISVWYKTAPNALTYGFITGVNLTSTTSIDGSGFYFTNT